MQTPSSIKRRLARIFGVLSSRLYLTAKDLEALPQLQEEEILRGLESILEERARKGELNSIRETISRDNPPRFVLRLGVFLKPFLIELGERKGSSSKTSSKRPQNKAE